MDMFTHACVLLALCVAWLQVHVTIPYNIRTHPCCLEPTENLTLAMIIDAFEIYGHDPTDKLDNLWLYQTEMMRIKTAEDQYLINERIHIATDHLGRFIRLHIQELKVLLITLDDVIDNMLTMYENHNSIAAERKATYSGGPVPMEFYVSQEFYCGKNVYLFVSELYSDIYNMGRGIAPYCKDRSFVFLGFLHFHDEQKYYLLEDPSITFPMDNYIHGLECHIGICIFRFPFKKLLQKDRDVITLPKAIVKCGLVMYKLPPLTATSCIIASGSFILDFNIQGLRYRHYDFLLTTPNGQTYYTKEQNTPLVCDHHVCEWNYTNHYGGIDENFYLHLFLLYVGEPRCSYIMVVERMGRLDRGRTTFSQNTSVKEQLYAAVSYGPFLVPGDPGTGIVPIPPYIEPTPAPNIVEEEDNITVPYILDGCLFMYPPNYGSIAGKSYLDSVELHDDRFTCNAAGNKGLYWYPQWMGALPHHPYPTLTEEKGAFEPPGPFYPHQNFDTDEGDKN